MNLRLFHVFAAALAALGVVCFTAAARTGTKTGPIRVLFLGHDKEHHNSSIFFPMLAEALGPEAVYFDYVTTPAEAFGDPEFLKRFDAVLLYANHDTLDRTLWKNLDDYVRRGGGFVPVHSGSACFRNIAEFDQLVGGRFQAHGAGVFKLETVVADHPAIRGVPALEAWDESYRHSRHHPEGRTVLQVRSPSGPDDNITQPEPWTWVREHGRGRVFYTASGHDERVWSRPEFHRLLKAGLLWAAGDARRATYESFLSSRQPLRYEPRPDIPNYEKRPEPLPWQYPLSPEESLKYTQAPMGFRIELFAAEPQIVNPICLAWDERGRLWVAETLDYPNEVRESGGDDRIKILEDTDGDGRCDKVSVFADGLNIPTSITFAGGGVIVAQAPHFLLLKDTDGDDVADEREILLTGWGTRDTHAGPSNLRYGFDNRIWGTVGYSGFNGQSGGQEMKFGSGVFRLRADGSELEFLHQFNNNTWGLGFNGEGDVFGSTANRNPSFFCGVPETIYEQKRMSARMIADNALIHPITPRIRQVDAVGNYTAACGHAFASSAGFPDAWRDRMVFVNEPTGNLTGMYHIEADGSGYRARNAFAFVASADEWFSPVAAEVGPDGHLWLADWYNFIIQHNPTPTKERGGYDARLGEGNAHENPNRDKQHGRIYRVIWEKAPEPEITSLEGAGAAELVAALGDSNLFWRQTAQRLLVESGLKEAAPALRDRVRQGGQAAIHSLWALEGMGELDRETHQYALLARDAGLQKNAIRAIPPVPEGIQLFHDTAVVASSDLQVRREALVKFATFPESRTLKVAATELMKDRHNREDEWLYLALKALGGPDLQVKANSFGPNLLPNPSFEEVNDGQPAGWQVRTWRGDMQAAVHEAASGEDQAHTGSHALRIQSPAESGGHDTSFFTEVTLKKETEYRLSGWVKTSRIRGAEGALLNVHGFPAKTSALAGDSDWKELSVIFNTGNKADFSINCLFGGWGVSTGTAWYDDVALQEATPVFEESSSEEVVGDVNRGRGIFHEHQVAACIRCHVVGGQGGPIGPPLDGIASRQEEPYLRESLTDPQSNIAEGFQIEVSPMPPMNVLLTPQEFEDVMAYLMTLR